ncbi:MAG: hypothetical protein ACRDZU_12810, partial [Acidimicrobiales bacterium]
MAWGAVRLRVRADARRWWAAWLVLGLLVGLSGGTVMAAAAGARRTETALTRFIDETHAPDAVVTVRCTTSRLVGACPSTAEAIAAFLDHPSVLDATAVKRSPVMVSDANGRTIQQNGDACFFGPGVLTLLSPLDDRAGRDVLGLRVVEGRVPDPARADEVMLSPIIARSQEIDVGDRLDVFTDFADCADPEQWGKSTTVTVVGIGFDALDLPSKFGSPYFQSLHTTRPFARTISSDEFDVVLDLEPGVLARSLFGDTGLPDFSVQVELPETVTGPIEAGTGSDANALWVLALVAAVASTCVVGPATGRHRRAVMSDSDSLAGIGWGPQEQTIRQGAHALAIWTAALAVSLVVGLVASQQTPVGDARVIEPASHLTLDLLVFTVGSAVLLAIVAAGVMRPRWGTRSRLSIANTARVAAMARALRLRPPAVLGVQAVLEP